MCAAWRVAVSALLEPPSLSTKRCRNNRLRVNSPCQPRSIWIKLFHLWPHSSTITHCSQILKLHTKHAQPPEYTTMLKIPTEIIYKILGVFCHYPRLYLVHNLPDSDFRTRFDCIKTLQSALFVSESWSYSAKKCFSKLKVPVIIKISNEDLLNRVGGKDLDNQLGLKGEGHTSTLTTSLLPITGAFHSAWTFCLQSKIWEWYHWGSDWGSECYPSEGNHPTRSIVPRIALGWLSRLTQCCETQRKDTWSLLVQTPV